MIQNDEIKLEEKENHSQNNNKEYNATNNDTNNFGKVKVNQVMIQAWHPSHNVD